MGKFSATLHIVAAAGIAISMLAGDTRAATQGSLGTTSTGSLNFSVTKPARADINNLTDLLLPVWIVGDGAVTLSEDVCVYSTRPSGGYTVLATGSGSGGAFTLANGTSSLAYGVTWNDGGVGSLSSTGETLTANTISNPQINAATTSSTCNGNTPGPTARLIIGITNAAMSSAPSGSYVGTLTLLITPN
jgi:hypothetical protein